MTREEALLVIKENQDATNWFDGSILIQEMEDMLRYQMRFGEAETAVIMAALTLAGANFAEHQNVYCYEVEWDDDSYCYGFVGADNCDEARDFIRNAYVDEGPISKIYIHTDDNLTEGIVLRKGQVDEAGR